MQDRLFDVRSAAHYLGGISRYTVQQWLSKGRLMKTKIGRRTMIRQSELDRFVADGNRQPNIAITDRISEDQPTNRH